MGYKIQAGSKTWIHNYIVVVDVVQNIEWFVQQGNQTERETINMTCHFIHIIIKCSSSDRGTFNSNQAAVIFYHNIVNHKLTKQILKSEYYVIIIKLQIQEYHERTWVLLFPSFKDFQLLLNLRYRSKHTQFLNNKNWRRAENKTTRNT